MKKQIVVYYSKNGSNRFLAGKTADFLGCEAIELKPRAAALVVAATATKISLGNKAIGFAPSDYDSIILCCPLYMGRLAAPCNDFLRKYRQKFKRIDFITCCGSTDEAKNDTFGYGRVFEKLRTRLGERCGYCEAFPISMVVPEEKREDAQTIMNTRLAEDNFSGRIRERFNEAVGRLS